MHPLDVAPFWARALAGASAAAATWLVAADAGGAILRRLGVAAKVPAALSGALGYALVATSVGMLGLLHALEWRVIATVLLGTLLVRAKSYGSAMRGLPQSVKAWGQWVKRADVLTKCALFVCATSLVVAFCAAAYPAVWWDPIAYHLPIAALALSHHSLSFDPLMAQTGFPLLAESAALPAYALAGSAGAAMSTLGAGIVLALLCGEVAESIAAGAGVLAAMLVASSALWLWLAPSFYVDVPFALFAVAALSIAVMALANGMSTRLALLSGAFAGAAAAAKYPGLFIALVSFAAVVWATPRRIAQPTAFIAGFAAIGMGWYARTYVLTGDPLYPFVNVVQARAQHAALFASMPRFCGGGNSLTDLALLPWRMLTDPKMFCGDPGYALRLGLVLVVAAGLLVARLRPWVALASVLTVFWFYTAQQWRFLVDAAAIFALVAAVAAASIRDRARALVVGVLVALSLLGVVTQVVPWGSADASNSLVPGYRYLMGQESASDYLRRRLESYAASEWIAHRASGAKIFALDDVRDYYFGPNVAWGNSPYPGGWRLDWSEAPHRRYRKLIDAGYRYMVVNSNPAYTHRVAIDVDWTALAGDERAGIMRKVFERNDVAVYDLQTAR